ncbi:plasmid partitioning protein RepB [Aurantimonas sp. VKM B-3413]|uniref:plasmid partitioning protein RepB n=1 Tax=Aurantimonas sp. VKM B-3413 TaxID=2779401 RepID=UPI001E29A8F7|nr:plasmid partitioning protein RepB [Aurantimonas sp. VKM B-3413]MCB8839376.1 plasmid partitioning protein RepB [Aurantimonas sp. VKM B-3413]
MKRRDHLRQLLTAQKGAAETAEPSPALPASDDRPPAGPLARVPSGAVKAMGLTLGTLARDAEAARALRAEIAAGERVVELDTVKIEPSPVADRLSRVGEEIGLDEAFEALKASIAETGQQVPVLVRPHQDPEKAGRGVYQTAYGHRRIAAAAALGQKVRAIIRELDDAALVLAQGKENAERRDLSFIERAIFAKRLTDYGFERAVAQAALAVDKAEMSRLLQVAERVPDYIARAIGPAPKAGRPRWLELADYLMSDAGRAKAQDEIGSTGFVAAGSDERFRRLHARLRPRSRAKEGKRPARSILAADGREIARLTAVRGGRMRLDLGAADGFADFLAERLANLHADYEMERAEKSEGPDEAAER